MLISTLQSKLQQSIPATHIFKTNISNSIRYFTQKHKLSQKLASNLLLKGKDKIVIKVIRYSCLLFIINLFEMSRYIQRIKIGAIGESGVGKTHFLRRFLFGKDSQRKILNTLAVEFYEEIVKLGDCEVSLRIWDTSGQDKYRPIVGYHLRECQLLIFIYDLTDASSFYKLENWIESLKKQGLDITSKKMLFIGNKFDLVRRDPRMRQLQYGDIKSFIKKLGLPTTDIYEVNSNDSSQEDVRYIKDIIQQILLQILNSLTESQLINKKVKLGDHGVFNEQQSSSGGYCGECNIY